MYTMNMLVRVRWRVVFMYHVTPTFHVPLISRACRFSRVFNWLGPGSLRFTAARLRLLLTFQTPNLPFQPVSSSHNTTLHIPTHPTQYSSSDSKTCRASSTSTREYIHPPSIAHYRNSALHHYSPGSATRRSQLATTRQASGPLNLHLRRSCDLTTVALCTFLLPSRRSTSFSNTIPSTTAHQSIR
jgi:hypothetical protein